LVVEFFGASLAEVADSIDRLERGLRREGFGGVLLRALTPEAQADVWAVRKEGLGLYMSMPGTAKRLPFVEDTSVPPARLREFVDAFPRIIAAHGTQAVDNAHASDVRRHIRPLIVIQRPAGVDQLTSSAA